MQKQYKIIWNLNDDIKYKKIIKGVEIEDTNSIFTGMNSME